MKQAVADMLKSKKFIASIASAIVALLAKWGLEMSTEELIPILTPIMAYVVSQGIADHGKEKAKIENT